MPDQADVEQGLAVLIAGSLYPGGEAAPSAIGTVCRVYRGWPVPAALEADLRAGIAHVTVQPLSGSFQDTTRYPVEWVGAVPACPLTVETDGERILFTGSAGPGVVAGVAVDGRGYAWRATDSVGPEVVAAALGDLVRVDRPAVVGGAILTVPGGADVLGRAVSDAAGGQEVRRQVMHFRVTVWCGTPEARDQVAAFVDMTLAGVVFLDVGGWGCRVRWAGGESTDEGSAVPAWRRELLYSVEYPTVVEMTLPSMLFGSGTVNGAGYLA